MQGSSSSVVGRKRHPTARGCPTGRGDTEPPPPAHPRTLELLPRIAGRLTSPVTAPPPGGPRVPLSLTLVKPNQASGYLTNHGCSFVLQLRRACLYISFPGSEPAVLFVPVSQWQRRERVAQYLARARTYYSGECMSLVVPRDRAGGGGAAGTTVVVV